MTKSEWLEKTKYWKNKWPQLGLDEFNDDTNGISLYKFTEILNNNLKSDSVILADAGSSGYVLAQSLQLKEGQRFILDCSQMGMGQCLGAAIGVCFARNKKETIVICGDGSFETNLRAIGVIAYHQLPIKIFVWCNEGYLSIRNTQQNYFGGRVFGTSSKNGLYFTELDKLADCYDLPYIYCNKIKYLDETMKLVLEHDGPYLVEIKCDPNQKITPNLTMKNGKSCTLDDLSPFLSDEEMKLETIVD